MTKTPDKPYYFYHNTALVAMRTKCSLIHNKSWVSVLQQENQYRIQLYNACCMWTPHQMTWRQLPWTIKKTRPAPYVVQVQLNKWQQRIFTQKWYLYNSLPISHIIHTTKGNHRHIKHSVLVHIHVSCKSKTCTVQNDHFSRSC